MTVSLTKFGCAATAPQFGAIKPQFGHAAPAPKFGNEGDSAEFGDSGKAPRQPKTPIGRALNKFWDKHPGLYVKLANITNHPAWSAFP